MKTEFTNAGDERRNNVSGPMLNYGQATDTGRDYENVNDTSHSRRDISSAFIVPKLNVQRINYIDYTNLRANKLND